MFDLLRRYATEPEVLSADGTAQRTAMSWISHGDDLGLEVDIGQGGGGGGVRQEVCAAVRIGSDVLRLGGGRVEDGGRWRRGEENGGGDR